MCFFFFFSSEKLLHQLLFFFFIVRIAAYPQLFLLLFFNIFSHKNSRKKPKENPKSVPIDNNHGNLIHLRRLFNHQFCRIPIQIPSHNDNNHNNWKFVGRNLKRRGTKNYGSQMGFQIKFIPHERKRKTTFNKRSKSLKKAAHELATLCGIRTMLICFDPVDGEFKTWPENKQEIRDIVARYHQLSPIESSKYKYNLLTYLQQEIAKHMRRTKKMFDEMSPEDANRAAQAIESRLQQVRERIQFLCCKNGSECEDGSNMATSENCQCSDIDCFPSELISHAKDLATNHGDQNRDNSEEETPQYCEHISEDEKETNTTSHDCKKNNAVCHVAEPAIEIEEETIVKSQNCGPEAAPIDQDEHAGYDYPYEAMSAFNWHWMAMNYWRSQITMNNRNTQYPLAFLPPPMPDRGYPCVVPIAVRPPQPSLGFFSISNGVCDTTSQQGHPKGR